MSNELEFVMITVGDRITYDIELMMNWNIVC